MDVKELEEDPRSMTTPLLAAWVVARHHQDLHAGLPFLGPLMAKVARVHGEHDPRLVELERVFSAFAARMDEHLGQEEDLIFRQLTSTERDPARVARELRVARRDHEDLSAALARMCELSDGYSAPSWACSSYRTLLAELRLLEDKVLRQMEVEDRVLFPRLEAA